MALYVKDLKEGELFVYTRESRYVWKKRGDGTCTFWGPSLGRWSAIFYPADDSCPVESLTTQNVPAGVWWYPWGKTIIRRFDHNDRAYAWEGVLVRKNTRDEYRCYPVYPTAIPSAWSSK